ncbi:MAG TPA: tRNA dihydrouridine synthase DusB [Tepidisphaeraceae bacterium]|jgi:nifR3 family TIM-barrel protein
MPPLKIGNLELATNLLLAPIAGYCDVSFRLIARACGGVGLAVTDLLCPEGVLRENYRSMQLAATCEADSPLSMQLYGGDADLLCEAARWAEDRGAHVIDINMGCPVDKITKRDGGSKLLCDPDRTLRMVERVVGVLKHTPLTAKLRLGWDDSCLVAPALTRRLEDAGVAMITIHGRTTEMKFGGVARLDGIAEVVAAARRIPVIGNGDVRTPQDAARMLAVTGCAGVMIGRAALSQPWIFRDTHSYLTTGLIPPPPTLEEKCRMMRDHFYNLCEYRSPRAAIVEFRKRVSWYAKTMSPNKPLKVLMSGIDSVDDFEHVLSEFLAWRAGIDANGGWVTAYEPAAV